MVQAGMGFSFIEGNKPANATAEVVNIAPAPKARANQVREMGVMAFNQVMHGPLAVDYALGYYNGTGLSQTGSSMDHPDQILAHAVEQTVGARRTDELVVIYAKSSRRVIDPGQDAGRRQAFLGERDQHLPHLDVDAGLDVRWRAWVARFWHGVSYWASWWGLSGLLRVHNHYASGAGRRAMGP